jgi:gas vesicle protein
MQGRNVLLSILVSAAAGAVAGILFAPDKGTKTRRDISKRGEEFAGMARDEFEDFMAYTRKRYNEAKKHTDDLIEKGEAAAEKLKKRVNN